MTDKLDLDRLEALEKAATPAPWVEIPPEEGEHSGDGRPRRFGNPVRVADPEGDRHGHARTFDVGKHWNLADPDLIVAARDALPSLLRRARLLDEAVALLRREAVNANDSEMWWMDVPDRGGVDVESIQALLTRIEAEVVA